MVQPMPGARMPLSMRQRVRNSPLSKKAAVNTMGAIHMERRWESKPKLEHPLDTFMY